MVENRTQQAPAADSPEQSAPTVESPENHPAQTESCAVKEARDLLSDVFRSIDEESIDSLLSASTARSRRKPSQASTAGGEAGHDTVRLSVAALRVRVDGSLLQRLCLVVSGAALTVTLLLGFLLLLGLGSVLPSGVLIVLAGILHAAGTVGALWGWCRFFPHTLSAARTYRWQTACGTAEDANAREETDAPDAPAATGEEPQQEPEPEEPELNAPWKPPPEDTVGEEKPLVSWEDSVERFEGVLGELAVRLDSSQEGSTQDSATDQQYGETGGVDSGEKLTTETLADAEQACRQLADLLRSLTRVLDETDDRRSLQKPPAEKRRPSSLGRIRSQVESVERLVGRLMDLARLEAGSWESEASWVAMPEVLHEAGDEFRDEARQQSTRVSVRVSNPAREVFTDPVLLSRAVKELISNAVAHAGKGKQVSVSATVTAGSDSRPACLRIRVRDTGRGVPKKDQDRIFEAWRTCSRSRAAQDAPSSGLGLTLARACARRLGGDLSLESRSGKGSTFTLSVPTRLREEVG